METSRRGSRARVQGPGCRAGCSSVKRGDVREVDPGLLPPWVMDSGTGDVGAFAVGFSRESRALGSPFRLERIESQNGLVETL